MKKTFCLMMLLAGITGTAFAQEGKTVTKSDKIFELPSYFAKRKFFIDLGKGNRLQIELDDMADLNRLSNIDSLLREFLNNMEPFKDSLSDELTTKKIDYIIDSSGTKKIRIRQSEPQGSSFTVRKGEVAALKLEQDTINFLGTVFFQAKYTLRKRFNDVRYYKISFFLNDINELSGYIDGRLNRKIETLQKYANSKWMQTPNNNMALKADPSISGRTNKGYVAGGDYLNLRFSVDAQNYKSYFIPSFSLGAGLIFSSQGYFKRDINLSWDPNFLFAKNDQGQLKTFRNDFLTLTFGQGMIKDYEPRNESELLAIISLSYLIHREGEYFDRNTIRFGMGRLSLFQGKTKIEPAIYFNNFFKGVTPGLRWIQSF